MTRTVPAVADQPVDQVAADEPGTTRDQSSAGWATGGIGGDLVQIILLASDRAARIARQRLVAARAVRAPCQPGVSLCNGSDSSAADSSWLYEPP